KRNLSYIKVMFDERIENISRYVFNIFHRLQFFTQCGGGRKMQHTKIIFLHDFNFFLQVQPQQTLALYASAARTEMTFSIMHRNKFPCMKSADGAFIFIPGIKNRNCFAQKWLCPKE